MRQKRIIVEPDAQHGTRKITGEMEDEYHHIMVEIVIDEEELKIRSIDLSLLRCPEPTCSDCEENLQKLVGASLLHPYFRFLLIRTIGGERGCFHVLDLLQEAHDYTRAFVWDKAPSRDGYYRISRLNQEGRVRCVAYRKKEGE